MFQNIKENGKSKNNYRKSFAINRNFIGCSVEYCNYFIKF